MIIPALNWGSIFFKVFVVFAHWAAVAVLYLIGQTVVPVARKSKRVPATILEKAWIYICALGVCLFLAAMCGSQLGTHKEGGDDYMDPGETVVDYVASDKAQWTYGTKVFLVIFPVTALGIYAGFKKDKTLTMDERLKQEREMDKRSPDDDW